MADAPAGAAAAAAATSVQVAVRVRRLTPQEEELGCKNAVLVQDEAGRIELGLGQTARPFT